MITYASGRSKLPHWPINSPCRQRGREDRFSYAPQKGKFTSLRSPPASVLLALQRWVRDH